MPKLVPVSASKLMKILKKLGFEEVRVKGSHHFFIHPLSNKSTTVPVHSGEVLGVGILKQILRDIDLSVLEYEKYRKEEYGFEFKLPVEYSLARKNDINGDDYAEDYRYKNDYSRYFSIGVISSERIRQNALTLTGEDYHLNPVTLLSIIKEYRSYNAYLSSEVRGKRNTTINTYPAI